MLQQTRAETVRPFYERWVRQFPDLSSLARARLDDVLKHWEGLGYYSRARNLHRTAQLVRDRYRGELPSDLGGLRSLPGIGDYTAGAIASIAYGHPAAAVDGNVKRVLCRLLDQPVMRRRDLDQATTRLVPSKRPGDFNQGLMELGATICTPRAPVCDSCPVSAHCLAFARGTQLLRPARKPRNPPPVKHFVVIVVVDAKRRTLLHQRAANGLLGGLWEFPTFVGRQVQRHAKALLGADHAPLQKQGLTIHPFSHFTAHYAIHLCRVLRIGRPAEGFRRVGLNDLSAFALPAAQRRIADELT